MTQIKYKVDHYLFLFLTFLFICNIHFMVFSYPQTLVNDLAKQKIFPNITTTTSNSQYTISIVFPLSSSCQLQNREENKFTLLNVFSFCGPTKKKLFKGHNLNSSSFLNKSIHFCKYFCTTFLGRKIHLLS